MKSWVLILSTAIFSIAMVVSSYFIAAGIFGASPPENRYQLRIVGNAVPVVFDRKECVLYAFIKNGWVRRAVPVGVVYTERTLLSELGLQEPIGVIRASQQDIISIEGAGDAEKTSKLNSKKAKIGGK